MSYIHAETQYKLGKSPYLQSLSLKYGLLEVCLFCNIVDKEFSPTLTGGIEKNRIYKYINYI